MHFVFCLFCYLTVYLFHTEQIYTTGVKVKALQILQLSEEFYFLHSIVSQVNNRADNNNGNTNIFQLQFFHHYPCQILPKFYNVLSLTTKFHSPVYSTSFTKLISTTNPQKQTFQSHSEAGSCHLYCWLAQKDVSSPCFYKVLVLLPSIHF